MRTPLTVLLLLSTLGVAVPAWAQRLPFERSFDVAGGARLDISTMRGTIDVAVGEAGRVVVTGTVTVRVGWDVPTNAADIARQIAQQPPITQAGNVIRLQPPSAAAHQRAVTVAYQVRVPRDTEVVAVSDSGATTIRDVAGVVSVRTQSAAIELHRIGASATVRTGSGAVVVDGIADALDVTTSSSAFTARAVHGSLTVRTTSGAVDVELSGYGDVDIETGSSGIKVTGIAGAFSARTQSGRVVLEGSPAKIWKVSTGSGSVDASIAARAMTVDATSGSGSVGVDGTHVEGTVAKRRVHGTIGGGGPQVAINSRSGSIRLRISKQP